VVLVALVPDGTQLLAAQAGAAATATKAPKEDSTRNIAQLHTFDILPPRANPFYVSIVGVRPKAMVPQVDENLEEANQRVKY
jgi:hypothetical protein